MVSVTLVGKKRLLAMLTEALALEEVEVMSLLNLFLRKLRASRLDEEVKAEVEEKVIHLFGETTDHARTLTRMLREVAGSDRDEY